jgi:cell division protein FtsL
MYTRTAQSILILLSIIYIAFVAFAIYKDKQELEDLNKCISDIEYDKHLLDLYSGDDKICDRLIKSICHTKK